MQQRAPPRLHTTADCLEKPTAHAPLPPRIAHTRAPFAVPCSALPLRSAPLRCPIALQSRAAAEASSTCYAGHECYGSGEGADAEGNGGSKETYGVGAMAGQFKWWDAADLGANPTGTASASQLSYRTFSSGGFASMFMPFFSERLLPDEEGTYDQVHDHRLHEATPTNGKMPTYYCARATHNGHHIKQRCNTQPSANNAVARDLMTETLDAMKKGHWIDHRTRLISITMQMRNNNAGVRFVARYLFEITQMGAVLPSYDMETLVDEEQNTQSRKLWMMIALCLTGCQLNRPNYCGIGLSTGA